ncbi:hypothetical protein H4R18_005549, partial [Coemansia javaensis]
MHIHDLPNDVLRLVLEASLDDQPEDQTEATAALKANLRLLAVCRRWRCVALADVYSGVAVCYGGKLSRNGGPGGARTDKATSDPYAPRSASNMDLVISAGCMQVVKRVVIIVDYKRSPLTDFGVVTQQMRAAAEEWRGVRRLDITIFNSRDMPARRTDVAGSEGKIKRASAELAATMPGVCRVHFDSISFDKIVQELDSQLAVLYSDQLEGLVSSHPIAVPPDHTFRQLKSVSIGHDSSISYQHPRVDPAKLVSLSLTLWPSDHSWAPFSADGDSGVIEFPNLRRLGVAYWITTRTADGVEARHPDGHPWRLHFPKLDSLSVDCEQDTCPLLEYAAFPPRMGE